MSSKQNPKTDGPALRLMATAALIVASACAAPILATETGAAGGQSGTTSGATPGAKTGAKTGGVAAPVHCGIAIDSHFGNTTFRPWVRLQGALPGRYSFALTGGGTAIDQGGSFEVGPGGQSLLGEATVSGPASAYDVELTVTVGGTLYRCRGDATDI